MNLLKNYENLYLRKKLMFTFFNNYNQLANVSITGPSSPTRTVCSKCAEGLLSFVTTVQTFNL